MYLNSAAYVVAEPPEVHAQDRYAIIVDAGSSGSRLFVYCFQETSPNPDTIRQIRLCVDSSGNPLSKKVTPGLSSFGDNPTSVDEYISDLMTVAVENVPKQYHKITPVYVLATAGMRLLPEHVQTAIWERVKNTLTRKFNFAVFDTQTVSGYYEALYGWITVNYLLNKFDGPRSATVGMLDMGGASQQIAYELPADAVPPPSDIAPVMSFKMSEQRVYNVYVMTFLGYGTQAAKSRYKVNLLHQAMEYSRYANLLRRRYRPSTGYTKPPRLEGVDVKVVFTTGGQEKIVFQDPCLQTGLEDQMNPMDLVISRTLVTAGKSTPIVVFQGTGDLTACMAFQQRLLQKNKPCQRDPCSMNGIHQPAIDFDKSQFYAMSEYWYTSSDLIPPKSHITNYEYSKFSEGAQTLCATPWGDSVELYRSQQIKEDYIKNKQSTCFKASWVMNVLHSGYGFPQTYSNLHPIDELSGIDVQWSLGALIYYMEEPVFKNLLSQPPDDNGYAHKTARRSSAFVILLLLIGALCALAYYIYTRRGRSNPHRFSESQGGGAVSSLFKRLLVFRSSNAPTSKSVVPNGGSGSRRTSAAVNASGQHYAYSKIASPSAELSFRTSNSQLDLASGAGGQRDIPLV